MNNNQILTSSLLDILFEGRNKEYGAYELRANYPQRVKQALSFAALIVAAGVATTVLARSENSHDNERITVTPITIERLPPEEEIPPTQPPQQKPEPEPVRTQQFTNIALVQDDIVTEPPPDVDDLSNAKIDVFTREGTDFDNIAQPNNEVGDGKNIIAGPKEKEPEILEFVQVEAEFPGGIQKWIRFLERNCDGQIASENGAPAGRHTVVIRFVVDEEGNVSNLVAMTNIGFGMEEEAMNVLKKASKMKWKPAIQNGRNVKAYRSQPITFEVLSEY